MDAKHKSNDEESRLSSKDSRQSDSNLPYRYQTRGGIGGLPALPTMLAKGIAAGIGLVSESIHDHKEAKKKRSANEEVNTLPHEDTTLRQSNRSGSPSINQAVVDQENRISNSDQVLVHEERDEEQWDLDDAQDHVSPTPSTKTKRPKASPHPKVTTQNFIDRYPAPTCPPQAKLALPVVLPQRRPAERSRGFIRAYAPELEDVGVDQAMFLDFLETFNEASQASPLLNAVNLAGFAFMALPTGIGQAATVALYLTVEVAKAMQSRARYVTHAATPVSNIEAFMSSPLARSYWLYTELLIIYN
jgi:hypothetical protein